jgi:hypothetical protein
MLMAENPSTGPMPLADDKLSDPFGFLIYAELARAELAPVR